MAGARGLLQGNPSQSKAAAEEGRPLFWLHKVAATRGYWLSFWKNFRSVSSRQLKRSRFLGEIPIQPSPDPNLSHENETHACRHAGLNFHRTSWAAHHPGEDQEAAAHQPGEKYLPSFRTCGARCNCCTRSKGQHCCAASRFWSRDKRRRTSPPACEQKGAPQHLPQSSDIGPRPEIRSLMAGTWRIELFTGHLEKTMRRDVYFWRLVWSSRIPICQGMLPYFFAL